MQTLSDVSADQRLTVVEQTTTPPVPDGHGIPGTPLRASRSGDDVLVTWDAATCPAIAVNLYRGSLGGFATFLGGACALPATGSATVAIPQGSWFLIAATNGGSTDGSYGSGQAGAERAIDGASAVCAAITQHVVAPSCP